jgi:GNAT superfamily N-acetyltransferase
LFAIRALDAQDSHNYRSILERTSSEDRYCRFFHAVDHFDPHFIEEYVVRRPDMFGFIALDGNRPLGTAHAIAIDAKTAELAILVAADSRRKGVARALVARLTEELRRAGFTSLVAYSLRENTPFARLARAIGMRPDAIVDGSVSTWRLTL